MATQRMYINGQSWEIMGEVTDHFQPYSTEVETSRSGRNYPKTKRIERYVEVENVLADPADFPAIRAFFSSCEAHEDRFAVTITEAEDCAVGQNRECIYTGCLIRGEASHSKFERKISGFAFSYEDVQERVT